MGHISDEEGEGDARLTASGVHIWAIVGYVKVLDGDLKRVARDYGVPDDEVRAALDY